MVQKKLLRKKLRLKCLLLQLLVPKVLYLVLKALFPELRVLFLVLKALQPLKVALLRLLTKRKLPQAKKRKRVNNHSLILIYGSTTRTESKYDQCPDQG